MKIDPQFSVTADARIVAKAYAVYIDQLLEEIRRLNHENDADYHSREEERLEVERSIFKFVLKNFGRQKLIEMGRFVDENETTRKGSNPGYEEHLDMEY